MITARNFPSLFRWLASLWLAVAAIQPASAGDFAANYGFPTWNVQGNGVAMDAAGNSYVAGQFNAPTATFGAHTLNRIGSTDGYLIKVDPTGTVVWAKNYGGAGGSMQILSVAVDGSGNLYASGSFFTAHPTTPPMTRIGTFDAFVMKLDAAGDVTWARNYGGAGALAQGRNVAVDVSGNVYLAGDVQNADLTTPPITRIGTKDAFLFKLDSGGALTWARNYGGAGAVVQGNGVAVDGPGNVYLTGFFQVANLTTPALTRIGSADFLLIKTDSGGTTTWSRNYGGPASSLQGTRVALDSVGNPHVSATLQSANLTTPPLTRLGGRDAVAMKLDTAGNLAWIRNFGGAFVNSNGNAIALDANDNVYLKGQFFSTNLIPLTTPALAKIGSTDMYAVRINPAGIITWAMNYGGTSANMQANGIAVDANGDLVMVGYFQIANLTTPPLTNIGANDTYVIRQSTVLNAPVIGTATGGNSQATVTFTAPAPVTGGYPITGYVVTSDPPGGVDADAGTLTLSRTITGLTNGTTYTFTVRAINTWGPGLASAASNGVVPGQLAGACGTANGVASLFTPAANLCAVGTASAVADASPWTWSCTGPFGGAAASCSAPGVQTATSTGLTRVTVSGGAWVVDTPSTAGVIPLTGHAKSPPVVLPPGYVFPHGLYDFTLAGGTGPATVVITYPSPLPAGTVYYKYGKTTPAGTPEWYVFAGAVISPSRLSVTLTLTDGAAGDSDGTVNGAIADPGGPAVPPVPVAGACGTANGVASLFIPAANLCAMGAASAVADASPWTWNCTGLFGGAAANCSAPGAPTSTGTGSTRVMVSGGGWVVDAPNTAGAIPLTGHAKSPPVAPPPGYTFPHGLYDFTLVGGAGPATVVITYPTPLPAGAVYYKYGKTTPAGAAHWYVFTGAVISPSRLSVTLTLTDGGLGDSDGTVNGVITDPGGPAAFAFGTPQQVPTLSEWAMLVMGLMMLGLGMNGFHRGRRGR